MSKYRNLDSENRLTVDDLLNNLTFPTVVLFTLVSLTNLVFGIAGVSSVFILESIPYRCQTCLDQSLAYLPENQVNLTDFNQQINLFFETTPEKCQDSINDCSVNDLVSVSKYDPGYSKQLSDYQNEIFNCCSLNANATSDQVESCSLDQIFTEMQDDSDEISQNYTYSNCENYVYFPVEMHETAVSEFDLNCDREIWSVLASSMYYLGLGVGASVAGYFSDRFGRKPVIMVLAMSAFAISLGSSYSPNIYVFSVCRFLWGFACQGIIVAGYPLSMEMVAIKYRSALTMYFQVFFMLGEIVLASFANFLTHWRDLQFYLSFWALVIVAAMVFVPESFRYYLARNQLEKAKNSLSVLVAKHLSKGCTTHDLTVSDKKQIDQVIDHEKKVYSQSQNQKPKSSLELFSNKKLRWPTVNATFNCFANSFMFYGLSLNAGSLPGSLNFNVMLNALMELPAYMIFPLFLESKYLGRRGTLAYFMILGGTSCLVSTVLLEVQPCEGTQIYSTLGQIFAFIGKFCVAGSFSIDYSYGSEMYPSELRSQAIGVTSVGARLAAVMIPSIVSLGKLQSWLPSSIFGVVGLIAGFLSFYLPETRGMPLFTTVQEVEAAYFS